jgi:hypothetical protein
MTEQPFVKVKQLTIEENEIGEDTYTLEQLLAEFRLRGINTDLLRFNVWTQIEEGSNCRDYYYTRCEFELHATMNEKEIKVEQERRRKAAERQAKWDEEARKRDAKYAADQKRRREEQYAALRAEFGDD